MCVDDMTSNARLERASGAHSSSSIHTRARSNRIVRHVDDDDDDDDRGGDDGDDDGSEARVDRERDGGRG